MPQQMAHLYQDDTKTNTRKKDLMSILSGVLLALLETALILNILIFHFYFSRITPNTMVGLAALLYLVAPIPLSFYISRQTGNAMEGWKAGSRVGWVGALLTFLVLGVLSFVTGGRLIGLDEGSGGDLVFFIMVVFGMLNAFGALLSLLGAAIGSGLGKIGKRAVS